jgi:hypothetical protein
VQSRAGAAVIYLSTLVACGSSSDSGTPGQWQSKRTEFVESCVDGGGPGVDPQVANDACSCAFDEVSRRWTPTEYAARHAEIDRELLTSGVLKKCRSLAQARHAPARPESRE